MIALFWIVVFAAAFIALAYARAGLRTTTAAISVLLLVCTITAAGGVITIGLWLAFIGVFGVLNIPAIRKPLLTRPALTIWRRRRPTLSATEHTALAAGTVWWEGELFSGAPNWRRLEQLPPARLSDEEQAFIDGPVQDLLDLCDEWKITHEDRDLPRAAWRFIKAHKFWGMIIPKRYGGLEFSAYARSCVLSKIGSGPAGGTVGPIVAAPNALGPAALLLHYGTQAQRDYYLPRLAVGDEIPCFCPTGPLAGSDAGAIDERGVVCRGRWHGQDALGIKLSWDKRCITLAPIASVLGLAFKIVDPERLLGGETELGVHCALIPTATPGCHTGRRHFPTGAPFQNGPTWGRDVFVPLASLIGGPETIGQGWRLLMQCVSAGCSIALPAGSAGDAIANTRLTGAYAVVRRQLDIPSGESEALTQALALAQALARIGGKTYACESVRRFTANAIDLGEKPAVASAIATYHGTTLAREVAKDTMDVHAGKAVMLGPSNPIARSFQAAPVALALAGTNSLTRSMMIYGRGAIGCHPYLLREIAAANHRDPAAALDAFDDLFYRHIGHVLTAAARSLIIGSTGGPGSPKGRTAKLAPYYRAINRYSANLALISDITLAAPGGTLQFRESLWARLGDVWSNLYIASATLKRFIEDGEHTEDLAFVAWVCETAFAEIETALAGVLRHLPNRAAAVLAGALIFPLGRTARPPSDRLGRRIARLVQTPGAARDRLTPRCYVSQTKTDTAPALFERAMAATLDTADGHERLIAARRAGTIDTDHPREQIDQAESRGILSTADAERLRATHDLALAVLRVDDFDSEEMRARANKAAAPPPGAA